MTTLRDEYHELISSSCKNTGAISKLPTSAFTPADTLVVVDMQHDFLPGGAFGVSEGDAILPGVCSLIQSVSDAGGTIIVTRDYHPRNHCSFNTHGGPFPPHCIQGTRGSLLHDDVVKVLQPLLENEETAKRTHVVYKAFSPDIDSFGVFPYSESYAEFEESIPKYGRLSCTHKCYCSLDWTGGYCLYASNLANDPNAPPDVMSVLDKKPLGDLFPQKDGTRMFLCGLAYDYCVIDSAVTYVQSGAVGDEEGRTYIVQDLTRAAHIPGVGTYGSGFLTDPMEMVNKMKDHRIGLVNFED